MKQVMDRWINPTTIIFLISMLISGVGYYHTLNTKLEQIRLEFSSEISRVEMVQSSQIAAIRTEQAVQKQHLADVEGEWSRRLENIEAMLDRLVQFQMRGGK